MKAVIYARYSCDNQREESIDGQLRECNTQHRLKTIQKIEYKLAYGDYTKIFCL